MLEFKNICYYNYSGKKRRYYGVDKDVLANQTLLRFTLSEDAKQESNGNRNSVLEIAKKYNAKFVSIYGLGFQIIGTSENVTVNEFKTSESLNEFREWQSRTAWPDDPELVIKMITIPSEFQLNTYSYHFGHDSNLFLSDDNGFYNVDTGNKITNRRQIVSELWKLGWLTARGKPLRVPYQYESSTPTQLQQLINQINNSKKLNNFYTQQLGIIYKKIIKNCTYPGHNND